MRPAELRDPVDIGVEVPHQRLHVDAVRGRTVVVERDERLLHEIERAAGGAASGAQVEPARELHEALEERAVVDRRLAPGLLPHLLRAEIAAPIEEPYAAADGGAGVPGITGGQSTLAGVHARDGLLHDAC